MIITGYAPDLDQTQEGSLTSCSAFIPTERGMQAAPSAQATNSATLAAACYGAASVRKLDNSFRLIAGTLTKLYELTSTTWTDQTRVSGDYTLGADNFWRFAQFGDTTLAAAKTDALQFSSSTVFADVTKAGNTAPKASIVETVAGFVFLFDTSETTYGDSPNRWWCAAQATYDDWVPAISTQSATGLLTSAPGRIFAGKRFGDQIVAYKERAMYIANYVGAPVIWNWQQIPGEAGCNSQEAVVNIGTADNPIHLFMGADDFWRFDGARPVPIGAPVRKTVYANLNTAYANRIKTLHDRVNSRVYFFYPSLGGNGAVDSCVVYHYRENRWGRDDRTVEAALEYLAGGITWDTFPYASWNAIPSTISWDSPFWTSGNPVPGLFNTTHDLVSLNGIAGNSSFTTWDMGDDNNLYLMQRVKVKWLTKPTSANMTNFYKASEGDSLTTGSVTAMNSSSEFNILKSARWHRLQFDLAGDAVTNQMNVTYQQDGSE